VKPPQDWKPASADAPKPQKDPGSDHSDRLDISDTSKRLREESAAGTNRAEAPHAEEPLPKKLAAVQERIAAGFYNREEVINHIAKRILDLFGFK
jgi:hypothetical protein